MSLADYGCKYFLYFECFYVLFDPEQCSVSTLFTHFKCSGFTLEGLLLGVLLDLQLIQLNSKIFQLLNVHLGSEQVLHVAQQQFWRELSQFLNFAL